MKLKAEKRERLGTSASKQARNDNKVPAIIYGQDVETTPVLIDRKEFDDVLRQLGRNAVFSIELEGKESQVLIKSVDHSALKPEIYNVELNALKKGQKVTVPVSIILEGMEDVKEGVVTQTLNEIQIETDPANIPNEFTVDVSELVIGDTVLVSELNIPSDVEVLTEAEETVVVVAAPRIEEPEETDGEATAAEPQIIGEKAE